MSDYIPVNGDNMAVTLTAGAILTGGLLVSMSADDTVVHSTSSTLGTRPIGVAAHDAPSGGRVTIYLLPGFLHELPVENGVTPVTGTAVVCSTTPGRITNTASAAGVADRMILGTFVRSTTGSTASTVRSRFLGA